MKSLIKAYALPLLVLLISGGLYYVVFSKSVQSRYTGDKGETIATLEPSIAPESTPPSINDQGEIYTTEQNTLHLSSTPNELEPNDTNTNSTEASTPNEQTSPSTLASAPQELESSPESPIDSRIDSSAQAPQPAISAEPATTAPESPKLEAIYYSKATSLNIRAIPKTSGRILGKLTLGQSVVVVEIDNEWAKLDSGGWVSLALLSPTQPSERLYVVIPNTLNIRQAPESSAPVVGALYKGQKIQVEMTQDEWAKLDSGGWVSLRLIKAL